jgi:hypothetical protein
MDKDDAIVQGSPDPDVDKLETKSILLITIFIVRYTKLVNSLLIKTCLNNHLKI